LNIVSYLPYNPESIYYPEYNFFLFCTTNNGHLYMKHIALVYTHIVHRRIMSQLLEDIVLWYCIPLVKHTFVSSVILNNKVQNLLLWGRAYFHWIYLEGKPLELQRSNKSYLLKHWSLYIDHDEKYLFMKNMVSLRI